MLILNLFGPGRAYIFDQQLTGFPNQQHYLLLCYLVLNQQALHPRERLAAVFWGDYSDRAARKYLRHSLWRLRQALESAGIPVDDYLLATEDAIGFVGSSPYWLDVEIFQTTLARYQDIPVENLRPDQVNQLKKLITLYTGDLLEGVYAAWCLHERERLRLLYLNLLTKLMAFHEAHQQYEQSLAYGERILALDSAREGTHRHMMRLYWLAGRRSDALAQYKRCVQILQEELDAPPAEETRRLYRKIISDQPVSENRLAEAESPSSKEATHRLALEALKQVNQVRSRVEALKADLKTIETVLTQFCSDDS